MRDEQQKVRLNKKYPKEDASTFKAEVTLPFAFSICPLSFFYSQSAKFLFSPSLHVSPSPHSLFMCSLLSSLFLPIAFFPPGQQFQIQTLLSVFLSVTTSNSAGIQVILMRPEHQ